MHMSRMSTTNQQLGLLVNINGSEEKTAIFMDCLPNTWLNFSFTSIYKLFQFNTLLNIINRE